MKNIQIGTQIRDIELNETNTVVDFHVNQNLFGNDDDTVTTPVLADHDGQRWTVPMGNLFNALNEGRWVIVK
jgi:hypothetical protein